MKHLTYLLLILTLMGCQTEKEHKAEIHRNYLKGKLNSSIEAFDQLNLTTGNTHAGNAFQKINTLTKKEIEDLLLQIRNKHDVDLDKSFNDIVRRTKYKYDTVELNNEFLKQAFSEFKASRDQVSFEVSLLLYNLEVIEKYRDLFMSYSFHFDVVTPTAILKSNKVRKGQYIEGMALTDAKQSAIRIIYELDDPQTPEGFRELKNTSDVFHNGKIRVKAIKSGEHIFKLRASYYQNGVKEVREEEFEVIVEE